MLNDAEFFAALLEAHQATTGADSYWEPVQQGETWNVFAVQGEERTLIAVALEKADADFICGVHGSLPQMVRRLEQAIDEAEAADLRADDAQHRIVELEKGNL